MKAWFLGLGMAGLLALLLALSPAAHAETMTRSFEGGMDLEITYPASLVAGREGTVSILVTNNGWEEKRDISLDFGPSTSGLAVSPEEPVRIGRLAEGGSHGESLTVRALEDAAHGRHFMNLKYSQVLVENNEVPREPAFYDLAIPVTVKGDPRVMVQTKAPESIFADAEFPLKVTLLPQDADITDVNVRVVPPSDIAFRGETSHTFSKIERGTQVEVMSRIVTPAGQPSSEHRLPFVVAVNYTDDAGDQKSDSQTVSIVLRPRSFMELTSDGGIWVGDFFIAPYISLGTIIGIPAGTLFSLLIKRRGWPRGSGT